MPSIWDDIINAPLRSDGTAVQIGTITSRAQAEAWHKAGYDIPAAAGRYAAFLRQFHAEQDNAAADQLVDDFVDGELALLASAGIGSDDRFFHLVAGAPRHLYRQPDEWMAFPA